MADESDDIETELDDADTEGDEEGTDGDEGGGEEWTPPTKQDWDNVQAALKKARRDARQAKRGSAAKTTEADADAARTQAEEAAAAKWKPTVVRTAARAAFAEAGLVLPKGKSDTAMARALRLLDVDDLEITDDGEVEGLAEQIEEIKSEFPELFGGGAARRPGRVDAGGREGGGGKKKSSSEQIADLLLSGR